MKNLINIFFCIFFLIISLSYCKKKPRQTFPDNSSPNNMLLLNAAEDGNTVVIKQLIKYGANINYQDDDGWTALMFASANRNYDVIKLLLENKVKINIQSKAGKSALIISIEAGDVNSVKLLIANNADINLKTVEGLTALKYAILNRNTEIEQILRNAGAMD